MMGVLCSLLRFRIWFVVIFNVKLGVGVLVGSIDGVLLGMRFLIYCMLWFIYGIVYVMK